MIVLLAKNRVLKGKEQEFLSVAEKLVKATREENGCLSYALVQDAADAQVFYFVEKYQDDAALEFHRASAHFQTYVPMLSAYREAPSEVTKCVTIDF